MEYIQQTRRTYPSHQIPLMDLSSRYGRYASMLQKWGWEPGKGLGKNEDGITEFVKLSKKKDSAGLGNDPKKDPWDNWWEKVYDSALKKTTNKEVETPEQVDQKQNKQDKPQNSVSVGKLKFVSVGTTNFADPIQSSVANLQYSESDSGSEEETTEPFKPLTGDELFKICEGRVFSQMNSSFNPTGKLRRLQQQEKSFKERTFNKEENTDSNHAPKKKRKKSTEDDKQPQQQEQKKKKKKKKNKSKEKR